MKRYTETELDKIIRIGFCRIDQITEKACDDLEDIKPRPPIFDGRAPITLQDYFMAYERASTGSFAQYGMLGGQSHGNGLRSGLMNAQMAGLNMNQPGSIFGFIGL